MLKQFMNEHPHLIVENQIEDIQNDLRFNEKISCWEDPKIPKETIYISACWWNYIVYSVISSSFSERDRWASSTAYNKSAHFNLSSTDIRANLEGFCTGCCDVFSRTRWVSVRKIEATIYRASKIHEVMFDAILVSSCKWNNDFDLIL